MINFFEREEVLVTTDKGQRVDISKVEPKSITNIFSALRLLNERTLVGGHSRELKILSDELIIRLLVRFKNELIDEFLEHKGPWGITYNQQFLFFVDSLIMRNESVFMDSNVNFRHKSEREFRTKVNSSFFGIIMKIDNIEYNWTKEKELLELINLEKEIYTNSSGRRWLIYNYNNSNFVKSSNNALSYVYFDGSMSAFPFIFNEFIERFSVEKIPSPEFLI